MSRNDVGIVAFLAVLIVIVIALDTQQDTPPPSAALDIQQSHTDTPLYEWSDTPGDPMVGGTR